MVCRLSLRAAIVVLVVVATCTVAVGGAVSGQPVVLQTDDPVETPPHENPGEATEPDESEGIESHLESLLADRLAESTDETTDGDYDDARAALDERYDDTLDRYAEVAGESDAELYRDARDRHTEFSDTNERVDELREAYGEARERGNDDEAEQLREALEDESTELTEGGDDLISSYRDLEAHTDTDHSEEIEQIETRQGTVEQFLTQTEDAGQINTLLLVETDRTNISFDSPARISGQLVTADGDPVADQAISIVAGGQSYSVETDEAGQFEFVHRPVESLGETTLDVEFRPNETSEYRATQREIPVTVEQVDADIQLASFESAASYDADLTTEGTVVADGLDRPVPGVSLAVLVDGQQLETVDTDERGEFSVDTPIPRSTDSGTADIEVRTVETDQAISSASETGQVQIESVETHVELDTETEAADADEVPISGSLETAAGRPIRASTVDLTVDGETVETVDTNLEGAFEETVTLPDAADNSTVTLGATYNGEGHLQPTTETVEIRSQPAGADVSSGTQPSAVQDDTELSTTEALPRGLLFAGGGLLALFGLVGVWWMRRNGAAAVDDAVDGPNPPSGVGGSAATEPTPANSRKLYAVAEQQLAADAYDSAVVLAYASVRRQLARLLGLSAGVTHRELARTYAAADREDSEAIKQLTQQYERVRYAADGVDESTAVRAVAAAERLLTETDSSESESS